MAQLQLEEIEINGTVYSISDADTRAALNTVAKKVPNDVSRTQNDAAIVHSESGTVTNLFWIRQATQSLAGLMTAADKTKLNALPTNATLEARLAEIERRLAALEG